MVRLVKLANIHVGIWLMEVDMVTPEMKCDLGYMLEVMLRIGAAIQKAYFCVPLNGDIYLILDGDGSRVPNDAVAEYSAAVKTMDITLVCQIPNSPDIYFLDLIF